jgi:hypothetical protein
MRDRLFAMRRTASPIILSSQNRVSAVIIRRLFRNSLHLSE